MLVSVRDSGTVQLHSMHISGGTERYGTVNAPLIEGKTGKVESDGYTTFENSTRDSGSGSVFEVTTLSNSFSLVGCTFVSCKCSEVNGSAEMMEIAPPYEPVQSHDWNWESEISTCTAHCRIQMAPPTAESPVTEQPLALMWVRVTDF